MQNFKNYLLIFTFIFNAFAFAETSSKSQDCSKISTDGNSIESELSSKKKLLNQQKDEMEKLPPDASNIRMKLTSEMFVTAAEIETLQNKIEFNKKSKFKNCQKNK